MRLSKALQIDLWTLDSLWWSVKYEDESKTDETIISDIWEPSEVSQRFGLEKHLHEFLRDNWNQIPLGQEWEIYSEPGDGSHGVAQLTLLLFRGHPGNKVGCSLLKGI